MMDIEDYDADYAPKPDHRIVITNIRQLNQPLEVNETLRAAKFLQFLNVEKTNEDEDKKKISLKERCWNNLTNSLERLNLILEFVAFATMNSSPLKFEVPAGNVVMNFDKKKGEIKKINYLKKIDHFEKNLKMFSAELAKINEQNQISHLIFKELLELKDIGFNMEDQFSFPKMNENISISLSHKMFKIYELLLPGKNFGSKYNFTLNYNPKQGKFDLKSKFYEKFISSSKFKFELTIKIEDNVFHFNHNELEEIITGMILDSLRSNPSQFSENGKYSGIMTTFFPLYVKYFLYLALKTEIKEIIRSNNGSNFFIYKNFTCLLIRCGKEYKIHMNYYEFLKIIFTFCKVPSDDLNASECTSSQMLLERESSSLNMYSNCQATSRAYLSHFVRIYLKNLIYDVKLYKIIKETSAMIKSKHSLADILEFSIYIKNISKIAHVVLRKAIIKKITDKLEKNGTFSTISNSNINLASNVFTYKFTTLKSSQVSANLYSKIEMTFIFYRNCTLYIELKTPNRNNIYVCEKDCIKELEYTRIDYTFLLQMIDHLFNPDL